MIVLSQHTLLVIWMCANTVYLYCFKVARTIEDNLCQNVFLMHIVASTVPHFLQFSPRFSI